MRSISRIYRRLAIQGLLASTTLASGCTTVLAPSGPMRPQATEGTPTAPSVSDEQLPPGYIPVVRQGRYTLVELIPEPAQRDLVRQLIDISIPPAFDATVGDALNYVLLRSGYQHCDSAEAAALYALPLPASHLRLGPISLRDALLTLAGPTWDLSIDETNRQVCFNRHAKTVPVVGNATTVPIEPAVSSAESRTAPIPFDNFQP